MNRAPLRRQVLGLGLIEIMISLVLGLLLTAGLIQIYLSTRQTYRLEDAVARRQESLRYATYLLGRDLRMAGYRGCLRDTGSQVRYLISAPSHLYNFADQVSGSDASGGAWSPALPAGITGVVVGTDLITARASEEAVDFTSTTMASGQGVVTITPNNNPASFAVGDIALLSDCGGAAVFKITGYDVATGQIQHASGGAAPANVANFPLVGPTQNSLVRPYPVNSEIRKLLTTSYYIRNSTAGSGPALWRRVGTAAAEELAEGVENMQIQYGEDTDNDTVPNVWVTANNVTNTAGVVNWRRITAVRIAMLVASTTVALDDADTRTFTLFPGDPVVGPFSDRKLRRVIVFTVTLRNRVL